MAKPLRLYLVAGEASGDLHGHNLLKSLRAYHPELVSRGIGGDRLKAAGLDLFLHNQRMNFMGFIEVVRHLPYILRVLRAVKADILAFRPDAVILIDYPGFNLRLARFLAREGIRVYYYISPQLWAWKAGRIRVIQECIRRIFVILPFEESWYEERGVQAEFVGHPLMDVSDLQDGIPCNIEQLLDREPVLALLPGSRKDEIRRVLPIMLKAGEAFPNYRKVIACAPQQEADFYRQMTAPYPAVELVYNQTWKLLKSARFAWVHSGTATLETGLLGVPMVVCYRGNWLSFQIARRVVKVPYISLVNLILEHRAVPELIQHQFTVDSLRETTRGILDDPDQYRAGWSSLIQLRNRLGGAGASLYTARCILEDLLE